jgi:hypothetical protein
MKQHLSGPPLEDITFIKYGLFSYFKGVISLLRVARWRSWLRHCATSRMVAGSIPDGVIGIFH